ncbi:beta-1,2-xylosyltransferase XYXT1 [Musa acuminata AAA Group]|uniref:beta-1,2-xylosyltransferase XYXT1 n=1 Tax=Musa acuminata AAA Group TaxID=214697 RepID=UPI0031DC2383
MGYEKTVVRNLSRFEARKLGLALLVGCCVVILTYFISMSETSVDQQSSVAYRVRDNAAVEGKIRLQNQERGRKTEDQHGNTADESVHRKNSSTIPHSITKEEKRAPKQPEAEKIHAPKREDRMIQMMKPICDLNNPRTEFCEMKGDVRIHGKSSSVVFVSPHQPREEQWKVVPYVRKQMENIPKVTVKAAANGGASAILPRCTVNQAVPAIVFALGGFTGNYYHDFTDVLLPLFLTARQFDGDVQFLITNIQPWWLLKYQPIIKRLTRYELVDLDHSDEVLCHPHVLVGLRFHNDLIIEPAQAPNAYSMLDFTEFLRGTYSLPRDHAISLREHPTKKPRLLVVERKGKRRFTNVPEIVRMAEASGFEVVRTDAKFGDVAGFASVVNSCDAIMGVHGAGLTNFVFLPKNAVLIQIVPCCELEGMASHTFRFPSSDAGLHYLEYNITVEESTLLDLYPRDHPVFTDPQSLHRQGFFKMGDVYLAKQNVRLDVNRFRPFLLKTMDLLRQ